VKIYLRSVQLRIVFLGKREIFMERSHRRGEGLCLWKVREHLCRDVDFRVRGLEKELQLRRRLRDSCSNGSVEGTTGENAPWVGMGNQRISDGCSPPCLSIRYEERSDGRGSHETAIASRPSPFS